MLLRRKLPIQLASLRLKQKLRHPCRLVYYRMLNWITCDALTIGEAAKSLYPF